MAQTVKNLVECGRPGFDPWVRRILWKRARCPILVFLPREAHGQRSLAGYSPWSCKESDVTEQLIQIHIIIFTQSVFGHQFSSKHIKWQHLVFKKLDYHLTLNNGKDDLERSIQNYWDTFLSLQDIFLRDFLLLNVIHKEFPKVPFDPTEECMNNVHRKTV